MNWVFDRTAHTLAHDGPTPWNCEAHGEAVPMPEGPLPAGTFKLGDLWFNDPGSDELTAEGPCFIAVDNVPGHSGIGVHGGGTGLDHPLAPHQGWMPTENCIRLQNADLYRVVLNYTPGEKLVVR